ncbi:MAG: hypothetical protein WAZ14_00775 [Patescibacteria group bacterium]
MFAHHSPVEIRVLLKMIVVSGLVGFGASRLARYCALPMNWVDCLAVIMLTIGVAMVATSAVLTWQRSAD